MRLAVEILHRIARLARLTAFAALVGGLLWAWQLERSLESARRAALTLIVVALVLVVAALLARGAARWGGPSADADDSLFAAGLLGCAGLVVVWLLGLPGQALPSPDALRTVQSAAALLSVLTLAAAGVGFVLGAWATSLREYVVGQLYLQTQVLAVLGCLVTIWRSVSTALR